MKRDAGLTVVNNPHAATLPDVAAAWWTAGFPVIVVTVQNTRGSAPRDANTQMLVSGHECHGTIGGGHLEWHAIARARALLDQWLPQSNAPSAPASVSETERLALGPALGQCCGGTVQLHYEQLDADHIKVMRQNNPPLFNLHLFGAGHVGKAVIRALAEVPCTVRWIDERQDSFEMAAPSHVQVVLTDDPVAEVGDAAPGDFYLVMTHRHDTDLAIATRVLGRGDMGYLGVIGSATKRARFAHRLQGLGLDPALMHCPVGHLDGSTGHAMDKAPWRIGLSVVNDLVNRSLQPA